MSARATVVVGVLTGALAAVVLIAVLVAFGPNPTPGVTPSPSGPSPQPSARPSRAAPSPSGPVAGTSGPVLPGSPGPSGEAAFHIGEPAPPLVVAQVGGGTIDLAAMRGKPVWVNFMATWCPPCVDEFPIMNRFAVRHADDDLVVVAVDVAEDEATVAAFVEELNATFPVGLDPDGAVQDAWQAAVLPVHFWVDRDGIVRDGALGGIGPDVMATGLGAILPGVEVRP
jgi:thiol-disulfide isomerase/thioredoxin